MPQVTGEQTEAAVSHKHRCVYLGGTSPQPPLPAVGQVSRPPEPGFSSLGFCMEHHGAPRLQVQHGLATAPRSGECCQAVWDNLFSAWHTPPDRQEEGAWGAASRGSQRLVWRLPGGSRSTFGRPIPESHPGHFRASVRLRLYPVSWRRHQVCLGAGSSGVTGQ